MSEDVRMPSFAEVAEHRADDKVVQLPEGIDALRLLQMEYRGEIELTYAQRRAAEACLPFERPKLGVVATISNMDDFASALDRAIARSGTAREMKLIEHQPTAKPAQPAPIPPFPRQGRRS